ncbi:MAG: polysaccharide pyruvyl transferase family protein [Chloroflexi bacterium]|nr:polysaccharide pyruvyl transferase family protein [Chloroflexota bacterium]
MSEKKIPSILILNFHSSYNAGDAALLESAISQLRAVWSTARIIVSANYPKEEYVHSLGVEVVPSFRALLESQHGLSLILRLVAAGLYSAIILLVPIVPSRFNLKRFLPKEWSQVLMAYQEADLVVNCPGNMFLTLGLFGLPFILSALPVLLAHWYRKPFYVMPQTLGPLKRRWERGLLGRLYARARIVFIREKLSLQVAKELHVPENKVFYVPDLAFGFSPRIDRDNARSLLQRSGYAAEHPAIGVTAISRWTRAFDEKSFDQYYTAMACALARISDKYGARIYFFPQVTGPSPIEDDRIAVKLIIDRMPSLQACVVHLDDRLSPSNLQALFSFMDIFLATRLHSGIFALNMKVPTLFVGYVSKTRGILESVHLQEWLVELDSITEDKLYDKLEQLWRQREAVNRLLTEIMPRIADQTNRVGKMISQDYHHARK